VERRLRIDAAARARWGARRRQEARAALRVLGVGEDALTFLGWPDLGITAGLLQCPQELLEPLRQVWRSFAPTYVVLPLARDTHPDHSALHLLARAAARSLAATPKGLGFAVHGGRDGADIVVPLTPAQFERKRTAVLQHTSQMALGSKRLLRFVLPQEGYISVDFATSPAGVAVAPASLASMRRPASSERLLLLAIEAGGHLRLAGDVATATSESWRDVAELWCKYERRRQGLLVFDRSGWQPLSVPSN
jgi:hypothetical protein